MLRTLGLATLFLLTFYCGFWITAAPFAVGWRLAFWDEPFTPQVNIALGIIGLIGGGAIAVLVTRAAARKWKT
ncbi:MAG: hypothetical protein V2I74_07230 [Erythrobacter sp.]|jgi:hypothetical protein|nr:hypothetical protein [Erythrobacter sp.]